ncbi:MAG TPA: hypothetical protein VK673_00960 [Chthoniobacterales bacterium]|nr:hypothetical protein [Chthoniobacterales bacterium]
MAATLQPVRGSVFYNTWRSIIGRTWRKPGLPGSRRTVTIFQPVGCISVTTARKFVRQVELAEDRVIDLSAVQLEQVLAKRPQGTQQSLDESVGKLRKAKPPNQSQVRYAIPMSFPVRGRTPNL